MNKLYLQSLLLWSIWTLLCLCHWP